MRKFLRKKGFTLIELMIVVAIIGILAAIAIPNFIRYQLRSKTTEAKVVLGGIKTSQESFRAELDNYANITTTNPAVMPGTTKTSWDANTCAATCNRTNAPSCVTFACIGYQPAGLVYYRYASPHRAAGQTTTADFAIGAQGDLDGDASYGQFSYRSANTVGSVTGVLQDGITSCAANIQAGEVRDCAPNVY